MSGFLLALKIAVAAICAAVAILFLSWAAEWQNSIRQLMQLEPVTSAHPLEVCFIAIVTFLVFISLARLFKGISRLISERSGRFVPRRVSNVIGFAVAILLFWTIANGVLVRYALHVPIRPSQAFDALIEPDRRATDISAQNRQRGFPRQAGKNLDGQDGNSSRQDLPLPR